MLRHFELEPQPALMLDLGLVLEVVAAGLLSLAIAEAILELEDQLFFGALQSCASCRHGPFELHPSSHLGGHCTTSWGWQI